MALMYKELQLPSEALLKYQVRHEMPPFTAFWDDSSRTFGYYMYIGASCIFYPHSIVKLTI